MSHPPPLSASCSFFQPEPGLERAISRENLEVDKPGPVVVKEQPNLLVNTKTPQRRAHRPPHEIGTALQQVLRLML
eukprot:9504057-Pyramimonas_sp.AAC.1